MPIKTIKDVRALLTYKQAAKLLHCKENTLAIWNSTKRYPLLYIKIGKIIHYRLSDVLEVVEKNAH